MNIAGQALRFGLVGLIGFSIDGGLLWGLVTNGVDPLYARLLSFPAAVLTTWWLNRVWTFTQAGRAYPRRQLRLYFALQALAALVNFAVYVVILDVIPPTALNALGALAVGAVMGMAINFVGSRRFIFRPAAPSGIACR